MRPSVMIQPSVRRVRRARGLEADAETVDVRAITHRLAPLMVRWTEEQNTRGTKASCTLLTALARRSLMSSRPHPVPAQTLHRPCVESRDRHLRHEWKLVHGWADGRDGFDHQGGSLR